MAEKILTKKADHSLVSEGKPGLGKEPPAANHQKFFWMINNGDKGSGQGARRNDDKGNKGKEAR